jgi:hypothetical protein
MTAPDRNQRPLCDKILERKREWGFRLSKVAINLSLKNISENCFETKSLEKSFIQHFIKLKFQNFRIPEDLLDGQMLEFSNNFKYKEL